MDEKWLPALDLRESPGSCRLFLVGVTYGDGRTLQEAADDLVWRLLAISNSVRASGLRLATELGPPDRRVLDLIWEAGELGERGEDVRARVFGPSTERRPTRVGDDPEG
jgi:hypothetical protein